jgi:uroporphyrinogen decarboxylase
MIAMSSSERVMAALSHREPDRVPFFLLFTTHGARELGLGLRDYLCDPRAVVEGQLRLRQRYGHDCFYGLTYSSLEFEAWGGETRWFDDGPPNAGAPLVKRLEQVRELKAPRVEESAPLQRALQLLSWLREEARGEVPVISAVLSPSSLAVMQVGFEGYLELLLERRDLLEVLLRENEEVCAAWGNAQLAAGASALGYFDPIASPTVVSPKLYRETGLPVARRLVQRIRGPLVMHLASARVEPVLEDLIGAGAAGVSCGADDSLGQLKRLCHGRAAVLGPLNGVQMRRWTAQEAQQAVREAISAAAPGGGFLLADQHGEVPYPVQPEVLEAIAAAVHDYGAYPIAPGVAEA